MNLTKVHTLVVGRIVNEIVSAAAAAGVQSSLVERHVVFPGRSQRRALMVRHGTRVASMSETEIGAAIARAIDAGLTEELLLELLGWLCEAPSAMQPG